MILVLCVVNSLKHRSFVVLHPSERIVSLTRVYEKLSPQHQQAGYGRWTKFKSCDEWEVFCSNVFCTFLGFSSRGCPRSKEALTQSPLQQEYSKSTKNRKGKQQKDSPCYDRSRNRITAMSLDLSFTPPREDSSDDDLLSVSHLLGNTSREKGGTSASQTPVTGTEDCSLLSSPVKPSVSTQDYSLLPSPVKPFDSTQDCSLLPSPVKQSVSTQDCFLLSSPMKPSVSTEDYSLPTSPIKSSVSTQGYSLLPSPVKPSVTVKLAKCPICSSFYQQSFIEEHAAGCVSFAVNSDAADDTLVSCPVCSKNFKPEEIEAHVNFCIDRIEHETTMENSGSEVIEIY